MKKLLLAFLLCGCAHPVAQHRAAPSSAALQSHLDRAGQSVDQVNAAAAQVATHAAAARSLADRIDAKATVILQNWK